MIEQPSTPIEQPEVDQSARRGAPSTPGLLGLHEHPAMLVVSTGSATPTVPLLAGLLVLAIFVAAPLLVAMVLGRILRNSVSETS